MFHTNLVNPTILVVPHGITEIGGPALVVVTTSLTSLTAGLDGTALLGVHHPSSLTTTIWGW